MNLYRLICLAVLLATLSAEMLAQQPSAGAQTPTPSTTEQPAPAPSERQLEKEEQKQRMLGVVPMFTVTSRHNAPPLTGGEKFHLFVRSAFDPFEYAAAGLQAGIAQAEDTFPEYGQGAAGFGKRYGASLADEISSGFFTNYFYPVLLKEDPRYFRLGQGPVRHRVEYSLAQEFVAHTDSGKRIFNFSNTLGALSTGGLSNLYYPENSRGFGLTMSRAAISLLYGSVGGLADEFWPDIQRKISRKHRAQPAVP